MEIRNFMSIFAKNLAKSCDMATKEDEKDIKERKKVRTIANKILK